MTKRQRAIAEEETPIYQKLWASTAEACIALGIGRTRLMELKGAGDLIGGTHWVHPSGKPHTPIGWDLEAVREWQVEKAKKLAEAPSKEETPIFSESIERAETRIKELKQLIKAWKKDDQHNSGDCAGCSDCTGESCR